MYDRGYGVFFASLLYVDVCAVNFGMMGGGMKDAGQGGAYGAVRRWEYGSVLGTTVGCRLFRGGCTVRVREVGGSNPLAPTLVYVSSL